MAQGTSSTITKDYSRMFNLDGALLEELNGRSRAGLRCHVDGLKSGSFYCIGAGTLAPAPPGGSVGGLGRPLQILLYLYDITGPAARGRGSSRIHS